MIEPYPTVAAPESWARHCAGASQHQEVAIHQRQALFQEVDYPALPFLVLESLEMSMLLRRHAA